jgi:hypothetical protein
MEGSLRELGMKARWKDKARLHIQMAASRSDSLIAISLKERLY